MTDGGKFIEIPFDTASKINGILFVLATGGKIESYENREVARLAYNILNPLLIQKWRENGT